MNPVFYENEKIFDAEIRPRIVQRVEEELGYEMAHSVVTDVKANNVMSDDRFRTVLEENKVVNKVTPIDIAISEECDEYLQAKRAIIKDEYSTLNEKFIESNGINSVDGEVIYNSQYSSTLIVKATKEQIKKYEKMDLVKEITLYVEVQENPELNIILGQVGVSGEGGTGGTIPGGWVGYPGIGVKVGVLEVRGRYNSQAPQIKGNGKIHFVDNIKANGTAVEYEITNHATKVVSIIAGKWSSVNSIAYEGIVPGATVYQTPVGTSIDVLTGIQKLVNNGVTVINYSGGSDLGEGYYAHDREVDILTANTGVVFVKSAGNKGGDVTSPGKAMNVITVGAADTKISPIHADRSPFAIADFSSYIESSYLPNKPDIVAPGVNISHVSSANYVDSESGTSYAAPVVTGIIAQMMEANSVLKTNPNAVKATLLLSADESKILTGGDVMVGNYIREKSGAGFVDAIESVTNSFGSSNKISLVPATATTTDNYYFSKGQILEVIMVFNKRNNTLISEGSDMDDIDILLKKADSGETVASSTSSRDNVERFIYTVPTAGYYNFYVNPYRIVDTDNPPQVSIVFKVR